MRSRDPESFSWSIWRGRHCGVSGIRFNMNSQEKLGSSPQWVTDNSQIAETTLQEGHSWQEIEIRYSQVIREHGGAGGRKNCSWQTLCLGILPASLSFPWPCFRVAFRHPGLSPNPLRSYMTLASITVVGILLLSQPPETTRTMVLGASAKLSSRGVFSGARGWQPRLKASCCRRIMDLHAEGSGHGPWCIHPAMRLCRHTHVWTHTCVCTSFVKYFHYWKKWYNRQQAELFLSIIVLFGLKPELTVVEIVEKSLPFKILFLSFIIVDSYVCQL